MAIAILSGVALLGAFLWGAHELYARARRAIDHIDRPLLPKHHHR